MHDSWTTLRETFSVQRQITASFVYSRGGHTLHVRKTTPAPNPIWRAYMTPSASPINPEAFGN